MGAFRYQALEAGGGSVSGTVEAPDRRAALSLLAGKGLFPSSIELCAGKNGDVGANGKPLNASGAAQILRKSQTPSIEVSRAGKKALQFGTGVRRKEITAFSREMAALLGASIPIPQALVGLGEEEENPALRRIVLSMSESVRKGASLSGAMEEHPRVFNKLYTSMIRVGEEAGALQKVMNDLATLLEHEDEIRSEVVTAVAYPLFVLGFGVFTVIILLTVVLPRLFSMLEEMLQVLPLPTLILLRTSGFLQRFWPLVLTGIIALIAAVRWYARTPDGAVTIDKLKLRIPIVGSVFLASALSRFARTLGTLVKSGVSLLPALKIVENTIGNVVLANQIARVSEETRGGDSLAGPLRKLGIFPKTVIQMISVGEESGKLDEMLLKVAEIEEREMRAKTKNLISLLAPALILLVGALVGFMVIALLLPIFKMSRAIH